jgi:hypothetical protein
MHPADLERLADLVADRLAERLGDVTPQAPAGALVDVKAIAATLSVSPDFVYAHAAELGGVKLADSPRAPWRFDVQRAREAMAERGTYGPTSPSLPPRHRRRTAETTTTSGGSPLLPIGTREG